MFEEAKGKKLLIIGGETNLMNIVNQAKEMGVYTIVTERGNDLSKLPAKAISDESWDVDYSNMSALVKKCREDGVNGVMSGYSEGKVLYAAQLSKLLGTHFYATPEQIELTRNKKTFKNLCTQYGICIPKDYCMSGKIEDIDRESINYPVIVKPADYGGRIGITVCNSRNELDAALELAVNASISNTVVVEEYLTGMEMTAIYSIADGEISLSIINDKYLSKEGAEYACLCDIAITPSRYYERYINTVDSQIKELIRGIGVENGIAGFQFIVTKDEIVAFEMGLRLNGGNDWKLLSACNGINHMKMLINYSLTGNMGDSLSKDNPNFENQMATYVMYAHGGKVGAVDYSKIENIKNVLDISPYVYVGKEIVDRGTTQQRVISFKIEGKSLNQIKNTIKYIQKNVRICDEDGNSMLFEPFDTSRLTDC